MGCLNAAMSCCPSIFVRELVGEQRTEKNDAVRNWAGIFLVYVRERSGVDEIVPVFNGLGTNPSAVSVFCMRRAQLFLLHSKSDFIVIGFFWLRFCMTQWCWFQITFTHKLFGSFLLPSTQQESALMYDLRYDTSLSVSSIICYRHLQPDHHNKGFMHIYTVFLRDMNRWKHVFFYGPFHHGLPTSCYFSQVSRMMTIAASGVNPLKAP